MPRAVTPPQAAADRRRAVGDQAHRHADALARRRVGLRRGHALRHGQERGRDRAVAVSRPAAPATRAREAAAPHRRRQGQRARVVARRQAGSRSPRSASDDEEPQVYLIAPDGGEARRADARCRPGASAIKWFPDGRRIAFVSWVWPDLATDAAQAKRMQGTQGREGQGARRPSAPSYRYWDHWLTDGREPHVFVVRRRDRRAVATLLAGTGLRAAAVGARRPTTTTSRPTAARSRSPPTRRRAGHAEPQRDIVTRRSRDAAQARC